jgi:hypothetical protein
MLIPGHENYDYDVDTDVLVNVQTGNTIVFGKSKQWNNIQKREITVVIARFRYYNKAGEGAFATSDKTGRRRCYYYNITRGLIRGLCVFNKGPNDHCLIALDQNLENDALWNLKWTRRIYFLDIRYHCEFR